MVVNNKQPTRIITRRIQDHVASMMVGRESPLTEEVAEDTISKFCSGCDYMRDHGICTKVGSNDQGRYVARQQCGWASVGKIRGEMTFEGFKPFSD